MISFEIHSVTNSVWLFYLHDYVTRLLDILANHKSGSRVSGTVFVGGEQIKSDFQAKRGYVIQVNSMPHVQSGTSMNGQRITPLSHSVTRGSDPPNFSLIFFPGTDEDIPVILQIFGTPSLSSFQGTYLRKG